jgi:hypothetical protein
VVINIIKPSRYCGSLADYGLPPRPEEGLFEEFSYNFNGFNHFFESLFVVFTFLNVTGWSGTTFMYWKAMTTYATAFYFVTLIFLLYSGNNISQTSKGIHPIEFAFGNVL